MLAQLVDHRRLLIILFLCVNVLTKGQQNLPDSTLTGRGEMNVLDKNDILHIEQAPNIVAPVALAEGHKVWILNPGEVAPRGWVDKSNVLLLTRAMSYFDSILYKNPEDW